jgi:5'-3' exonuclease
MAILLDWSHMLNRNVHASIDNVRDNPSYVAHLMLNMVVSEIERFGASKANPIIAAIDSKPYWREQYYQDNCKDFPEYAGKKYKGDRVKDPTIPWDEIYKVSSRCLYALNHWTDVKVCKVATAEADDVIGVASEYYPSIGQKVVNVTSDKDMRQTQVAGVVDIFDPIKKIIIPEINVEKFKKLHIMQGDKGDSILAIRPRLGEKTAEKLYPELDTLLATNPDMRARYAFNEALIDFRFIPASVKESIIASLVAPHELFDGMALMDAFQKLHLNQLMDKIGKFKLPAQAQPQAVATIPTQEEEPSSILLEDFFSE